EERVVEHKDLIFSHYDDKQQGFLDFVLSQYVNEGVGELDDEKLPTLIQLKYGAIHDATEELGDATNIRELFVGFQRHLYAKERCA
ncbi:MAG TPA: type I restriction-modification enzyme R subunit C-terminal domain-containing protein, partial [Roseibacillus sp.]|nr:type I restriction-modification enzyme R subunit C-terminal domain-containing protein [Roseibacillus sp.]